MTIDTVRKGLLEMKVPSIFQVRFYQFECIDINNICAIIGQVLVSRLLKVLATLHEHLYELLYFMNSHLACDWAKFLAKAALIVPHADARAWVASSGQDVSAR